MRKVFLIALAAVLAINLYAMVQNLRRYQDDKPGPATCNWFHESEVVTVVAGPHQGATGIVLRVSAVREYDCLYLVRGQQGVEMPFFEWYTADELVSGESP